MSRASITGAYNTEFGAFVKKDRTTGLITDTKTYYDLQGKNTHLGSGPF